MPYRLLNGHISDIMAAAVSMCMLAVTSVVDGLTQGQTIYDNGQYRMFCLIGALGGAFLAVAIFPPKEREGNYSRRLAIKFFASGVAGCLFTPIIMSWRGWPVNVDTVLAVSGGVALSAVTLIHSLWPILVRKFTGKIDGAFSDQPAKPFDSDTTKPNP